MNIHEHLILAAIISSVKAFDESKLLSNFLYALVENGCPPETIVHAMEYAVDHIEGTKSNETKGMD